MRVLRTAITAMLTWACAGVLTLGCSEGWAAERISTKRFQWTRGSLGELKVFERYVRIPGQDRDLRYTVGSVTEFELSATAGEISGLAEKFTGAMGLASRKSRRVGATIVHEGIWAKMNRKVQLFFTPKGKKLHVSLGIFRLAYAKPVLIETELLQRHLAGEWNPSKRTGKAALEWLDSFVQSAFAQDELQDELESLLKDYSKQLSQMRGGNLDDFDSEVNRLHLYSTALSGAGGGRSGGGFKIGNVGALVGLLRGGAAGIMTSVAFQVFGPSVERMLKLDSAKREDQELEDFKVFVSVIEQTDREKGSIRELEKGIDALLKNLEIIRSFEKVSGEYEDIPSWVNRRLADLEAKKVEILNCSDCTAEKKAQGVGEVHLQILELNRVIGRDEKMRKDAERLCEDLKHAVNALAVVEDGRQMAVARMLAMHDRGRIQAIVDRKLDGTQQSATKDIEKNVKERKKAYEEAKKDHDRVSRILGDLTYERYDRERKRNPKKFAEWTCMDASGCERRGSTWGRRYWYCHARDSSDERSEADRLKETQEACKQTTDFDESSFESWKASLGTENEHRLASTAEHLRIEVDGEGQVTVQPIRSNEGLSEGAVLAQEEQYVAWIEKLRAENERVDEIAQKLGERKQSISEACGPN